MATPTVLHNRTTKYCTHKVTWGESAVISNQLILDQTLAWLFFVLWILWLYFGIWRVFFIFIIRLFIIKCVCNFIQMAPKAKRTIKSHSANLKRVKVRLLWDRLIGGGLVRKILLVIKGVTRNLSLVI